MSRHRFWGSLLVVPLIGTLIASAGCGGGDKGKDPPKSGGSTGGSTGSTGGSTGSTAAKGEKTPLEGKGLAVVKGKVVYEGAELPKRADLTPLMNQQQEPSKSHCLKGETKDEVWLIGADKGVQNAVVWLRAPEGKYFNIPEKQRARTDKVSMDQPFCMFTPRIIAIQPTYFDGKKQVETGQSVLVLNSAPIPHNTTWKGNALLNPGANEIIPGTEAGKEPKSLTIKAKAGRPSDAGGEDLISVNCDIHKWMTGKIAVFDHPYYAVTDKTGSFEIKGAPAGAELTICVWHESKEGGLKQAMTTAHTLKEGENNFEFKIK